MPLFICCKISKKDLIGKVDILELVKKWTQINLVARIAGGLVLGIIFGMLLPQVSFIGTIGNLFVGALKSVAPVMVFLLVAVSFAASKGNIGRRNC